MQNQNLHAVHGGQRIVFNSANLICGEEMIQKKNLANAGWIIGCKIVQSILGVIISMLTARYLGPSQFGVINYAAAVVAFVAPIAKLGLSHVIVQEIVYSPDEEGKILGSSIVMSIISSIFSVMGVVAFSTIANPNDAETIIVCALYSTLLVANALEVVQYWFQAKLLSKYPSVVAVIVYVIISLYKAVLLLTKQSVHWFAVSNAIDHMIIGIALLVIYRRQGHQKLEYSFAWAKRLLSKSRHFIIPSLMVTIFAQTDKIMIKLMIDDAATGIYSAATTCAGLTSFVFTAIIDSMRPTIVEHKKCGVSSYETSVSMLYSIIIYLSLAQSVAMTVLSKPIILVLYGHEYIAAAHVLAAVVWYTTFSYMGAVRDVWILAEEKQRYLWIINLVGAITNVVLNLILIPTIGINGAAIASIVTQIFTNFVLGFIISPIRYNNVLMVKGLNPKLLLGTLKTIIKTK